MYHREPGPTRSTSIQSYLRETRVLAAAAGLALAAGVASDILAPGFWSHHQLLAGLASSLIVVAITIAVINDVLEWRSRRRWRVLAQYVMLQLVRLTRMVWMSIAELSGTLASGGDPAQRIDTTAVAIRDTARFADSVQGLLADAARRRQLQDAVARMTEHSDDVLGRWAGVMLSAGAYAELIDRHVELASRLAWFEALFGNLETPDDRIRQRRTQAHPAVQLEGQVDDRAVAERLVAIAQLAERLDRSTLRLATQLVPREWWSARAVGSDGTAPYAFAQISDDASGP